MQDDGQGNRLSSVSLALAVPAAAASLAYLSARTQVGHDASLLSAVIRFELRVRRLERQDRVNLFYAFEERALSPRDASRVWLIYEGHTWTWREAYDIVLKYARHLKEAYGVRSREVVAIAFTNKPQFLFLQLALWSLGALPALVNASVTGDGLVHVLRVAGSRIIIFDQDISCNFTAEVLKGISNDGPVGIEEGAVRCILFDNELEQSILTMPRGLREQDSARAGVGVRSGFRNAGLVSTSGTTGLPKAAYIGYYKIYAALSFTEHWAGINRNDVYYVSMPLCHLTANTMAFTPSLFVGYALAIGHRFSARNFWPEVRASNATVIQYVGETCRYLLSAPLQRDPSTGADLDKAHRVRLAFGNGLRPDIWQRFRDRFGIEAIAEFYSASEAPYGIFNLARNEYSTGAVGRFGSLIRALQSGKQAIVEVDWETEAPKRFPTDSNPLGFCRRVEAGTVGELLAALDPEAVSVSFQGYHGNDSAGQAKVLRSVFAPNDAWYRSGDTIRMDTSGRVFFCDRIGDTFRWHAENVSTTEVADALGSHPRIAEANVYGVSLPRHDGRAGCAAVTLNGDDAGGASAQEPSLELLEGLARHVVERLPKYARPLFVRVVVEMGKTGTNKQQKHVLRAQGVDPGNLGTGEMLYWLHDGAYRPFGRRQWEELQGGRVRL